MFADPVTERMAAFVRGIGIDVRAEPLPDGTFLPGLDIRQAPAWWMKSGCPIRATCCTKPATSRWRRPSSGRTGAHAERR